MQHTRRPTRVPSRNKLLWRSRFTSTASCTTKKTPRSASTITACCTATACSKGIRSYGGKVFRLKEHLERLWNSAKAIWLEIPLTQEAMGKAVNETLAANGIKDGYIRLVVTRGVGTLGLDPNRCSQPAGDHHHRQDRAVPGRFLSQRIGNCHCQHACATIRRRSARGSSRSTI